MPATGERSPVQRTQSVSSATHERKNHTMNAKKTSLPREVVALVRHVELNHAGWWDKTLNRLALASVWLATEGVDEAHIIQELKDVWHLDVAQEKIGSILQSLIGEKSLIKANGMYRISEDAQKKFEKEISDAEKSEKSARDYFGELIEEFCPNLDVPDTWSTFEKVFLLPMIQEAGESTSQLLAGNLPNIPDSSYASRFFKEFGKQHRGKLKNVVSGFLDSKRRESRDYVSRLLHASFCVEASGLSEEVLEKLTLSTKKQVKFRLFLDTNVLFSLLGLHENPANASAQKLKDLFQKAKSKVQISLRITPHTIVEAKSAIAAAKYQATDIPAARNLFEAALRVGVSGLVARFLHEKSRQASNLSVDDWFDPYLHDFAEIARGVDVDLFNENLDGYSQQQEVVDDTLHMFANEKKLRMEKNHKFDETNLYKKVEHDIILWHFVKGKRTVVVESPLEANQWILTFDGKLLRFDSFKRKKEAASIPLCLHPTSLIQLLQFWIPRTQEFEEAVLGGLRLPVLFQVFDTHAENLNIKILNRIGRFANSADIPADSIVRVVTSDGLRRSLLTAQTEEKEVELVHDALLADVNAQMHQEKVQISELQQAAKDKEDELARKEEQLADHQEKRVAAENQLVNWQYFAFLLLTVVLVVSVAIFLPLDFIAEHLNSVLDSVSLVPLFVSGGAFLLFHWSFERSMHDKQALQENILFKAIKKVRQKAWAWGLGLIFVLEVLANYASIISFFE